MSGGGLVPLGPWSVHESWVPALAPHAATLDALAQMLATEHAAGVATAPGDDRIMRAFQRPLDEVRVLIVGQDPYPGAGHAVGLSFAVDAAVRPVPRSLGNIYTELRSDLGVETPAHGELSAWAENGVMLMNRVLTVRVGDAGSHRRRGWESITDAAIAALVARGAPLVSILWGRDAQALAPALAGTSIIESAHPSPLSARRGFFGSRPFSRANELLAAQGAAPVDWRLPERAGASARA